MKVLSRIVLVMFFIMNLYGGERILIDKDLNDHYVTIENNSYKILEFKQRIKNIKVSDSKKLDVEFISDKKQPLAVVKVFSKSIGNANILVTHASGSTVQVNFNIVNDLKSIINMIETIYPKVKIAQVGDNVVLKGELTTNKEKKKILEILSKAGIDTEKKVIDTIDVLKPEKMIRIKLYAVEINNDKGLDLKKNWLVSSKNYMRVDDGDMYMNAPLGSMETSYGYSGGFNTVNNQRMMELETALNAQMTNAVTLTGGITGIANYLGKYFNVGLTLNFLASKGVARILDETTLITTEGNEADFHAGGTIYVKIATTTAQGVPTTQLRDIKYGLKLKFDVNDIVKDSFMNMDIDTQQTQINWANQVDGLPSFTEKSVKTKVVALDKATILIGGLINSDQSKYIDKIPLLGDIPILGALFRSEDFQSGNSELVFFVTPEIVDTELNDQAAHLNKIKEDIQKFGKENDELIEGKSSKKDDTKTKETVAKAEAK